MSTFLDDTDTESNFGDVPLILTPSTKSSLIPCVLCGLPIISNSANQCAACLRQQFDLKAHLHSTRGTAQELHIFRCKRCLRYQSPSNEKHYEFHEEEAPELLTMCLKAIPALQMKGQATGIKITLLDAGFIWTEPHSMRIKLKLTVKAEILELGNLALQQRVGVELFVRNRQCQDCQKEFQNQTWMGKVQLRQKRTDGLKKGLAVVEANIANSSEIRKHIYNLETCRNGFDFYFSTISHATQFVAFLGQITPLRTSVTRKFISTDNHSNTANIKQTFVCDMVPLSKDDLVVCSKAGVGAGKLKGRLGLVTRVSSWIHLVNAAPSRVSLESADLTSDNYFKNEKNYVIMLSSKRLTKFVVMEIEILDNNISDTSDNSSHRLAEVTVVKDSDYNKNFFTTTHLGNILSHGDEVLGYDLKTGTDDEFDDHFVNGFELPDVVLVRKIGGLGKGGVGGEEPNLDLVIEKEKEKTTKRFRRKKKGVSDEENSGGGHRGAKKQAAFETSLKNMGILDNEEEEIGDEIETT
ncbi:hypothetical protein ScalyP_jg3556 [Parmales sp. scaly parma]|nr:hypothetical protein ScalyP_jg3556 [Parmales sp. scaly parma]